MKIWEDWQDYRRFRKLPPRDRNIVFYSETHQDWHHLQPLIDFLVERLGRTLCHVTSERTVPLPSVSRPGLHGFRIRSGAVCTWFFQMLKADVMVLTMLDLQNFQLKRSIHPVHYLYVFHSMGSTHMVDHENSYDHYDTLLCAGPHHVAEIQRREQLKGLPPKHLFAYGYPRLERLVEVAAAAPPAREASNPTTVLLAPTWGEQSILHVCGEPLIAALLGAGMRVIMRPHYQTARQAPRVVERLVARFGTDPRFRPTSSSATGPPWPSSTPSDSASRCSSSTSRPACGTRNTRSWGWSRWRCASGASSGRSCHSIAWRTRRNAWRSCSAAPESSASARRRCGKHGRSTSAGVSRWGRGRSRVSRTSGQARACPKLP